MLVKEEEARKALARIVNHGGPEELARLFSFTTHEPVQVVGAYTSRPFTYGVAPEPEPVPELTA